MIFVIYSSKKSYKRLTLRSVTWWMLHPRNIRFYFVRCSGMKAMFHCTAQFMLLGFKRCNDSTTIRFLNLELEVGY